MCLECCLFRDGVQFCSGLVDLVVCVGHQGGGGHRLAFPGERFVGLVAEEIAEMGDRRVISGNPAVLRGSTAKPAMTAAGSYRPSRSNRAVRTVRGTRIWPVLPASSKWRIATMT